MVFYQFFVTKEPENVVACIKLCSWICYSYCIIFHAVRYDLL